MRKRITILSEKVALAASSEPISASKKEVENFVKPEFREKRTFGTKKVLVPKTIYKKK